MEKTFSIITIGCKLNQYESECMREALIARNWEYRRVGERAGFCIINTCTVTGRSDARCRNAIRRSHREIPEAFIVVTGCYAETQPRDLEMMDEVDLVLGNEGKRSIAAILEDVVARGGDAGRAGFDAPGGESPYHAAIEEFVDHSRAFIKVQEGCSASCSYCIVPLARGPSRSVPAASVLSQAQKLRRNGYEEIVLTGVHIGRYGADLDPPASLASLVTMILEGTGSLRLRLSSIEPTEVTSDLLAIVRQTDRLAPHFHVPLQSGDDRILAAMNRPYRAADFRSRIEDIARSRAGVAIGTDIIVGFPGETDECFERTRALVQDLPLSHFHVFSFSRRPLTRAAAMDAQVSAEAKKDRSRRLIDLGKAKKQAFLRLQVGTTQLALIEGPMRRDPGYSGSLTGNYCEVIVPSAGVRAGSLVPVRIERFTRGCLHGMPLVAAAGGVGIGGRRNP